MARPIWSGHISFGLVNIPVKLLTAEQRADLHFNLIDSRNHSRVRYERVNELTGEEVPWNQIVKGYEYADGNYVLLSDEDFKKAAVEATQTVEIEDFVDLGEISWMYIDKPYYLAPGKRGEKGYVLLREVLTRSEKAAIARVVIRSREHLAAVVARGPALVLILLRFHQELRELSEGELPTGSLKDYKISAKELQMAEKLVESMTGTWDPAAYKDEYRSALLAWIEKKAQTDGIEPVAAAEETEPEVGSVVNIMDLLEQSVKAKQKRTRTPSASKKKAARKKRA